MSRRIIFNRSFVKNNGEREKFASYKIVHDPNVVCVYIYMSEVLTNSDPAGNGVLQIGAVTKNLA